jgi:hypothetical protein
MATLEPLEMTHGLLYMYCLENHIIHVCDSNWIANQDLESVLEGDQKINISCHSIRKKNRRGKKNERTVSTVTIVLN